MLSRVRLFRDPMDCSPHKLLCLWDFSGKNTGVGCHFPLQGIFPTQGSNLHLLCLLPCSWLLYHLSLWGSQFLLYLILNPVTGSISIHFLTLMVFYSNVTTMPLRILLFCNIFDLLVRLFSPVITFYSHLIYDFQHCIFFQVLI